MEQSWLSDNRHGRLVVVGDEDTFIFNKQNGWINVRATNVIIIYTNFRLRYTILGFYERLSLQEEQNLVYFDVRESRRRDNIRVNFVNLEDIMNYLASGGHVGRRPQRVETIREGIANAIF